jgi:hypothetical protein
MSLNRKNRLKYHILRNHRSVLGLNSYTAVYSRESSGLENISQILSKVFASAFSKMAYGLEQIPMVMRNS